VVDADGRPRHRRGVTEIPSLYFLGLSWQHTRGSALLGWVADDAEFIAGEMEAAARLETAAEATNYEHESAPTPRATGAMEGV
jgi:putative flavoprotein involved in K+ transport